MTRPRTLRGAPGLLLAALLAPSLGACGAASRDAVLACTLSSDCGPGARCVEGACQASTPPVADFAVPAALTTNRAVAMTASASDPDPGDAVVAWAWTVTPLSAACDADVDVADAATLQAVFWCAGTYQVALVVTDAAGAASPPVRRTATVTALPGAPSVTAGPPVAVDHRCTGAPLRCELAGQVTLSADGQAPLGGPLTYRWTALPPDPSRAGAAAVLSPSPAAQAPGLSLTTGGGALSGTWRLRVRAADAFGNLAQAVQLVTVGNGPPVIDESPRSLDHRFEGGAYRADGVVAVPVSDPDGDPVQVGLVLQEPAGSGCASGLTGQDATGATLALSCPAPAGLLAPGRALVASATDVNGAPATGAVPIQVLNRLPVVQPAAGNGLGELELDHTVGPCPAGTGSCFLVAGASPFVAIDPDGDPVTAVTLLPGVAPGHPASRAAASGDTFRFGTPVSLPAEFRDAAGASGFSLTATASDPFGASAPAAPLAIRIRNRPPVVKAAVPAVTVDHRYDASTVRYRAAAGLGTFEDPDGDPLLDAGGLGDESCAVALAGGAATAACERPFAWQGGAFPTLAGFAGSHALVARATDGWAAAQAATSLTIANAPPTVQDYTGAVEACRCRCPAWDPEFPTTCALPASWVPDLQHATFQLRPADADGDPLAATFSSAATVNPASDTALPDACTTTVDSPSYPVSVNVTVSDGVSQAAARWTVVEVICSKAGQECTATRPLPVGYRRP